MRFSNERVIPRLDGKTALVTGGNTGLGFETAKALIDLGATVYILCRNKEKGEQAVEKLGTNAKLLIVDLADLNEVSVFAKITAHDSSPLEKLDILINNAGVMNIAEHTLTKDGLETQIGVNHFGHFALTTGLLPLLKKSDNPRVVTVASIAAYGARLDFDNLRGEKYYRPYSFYKTSKLCNLLFGHELALRYPWLTSVIAHPGVVHTSIQQHMKQPVQTMFNLFQHTCGQTIAKGILPIVAAATMSDVHSGMYLGSKFVTKGPVDVARKPIKSRDKKLGRRLWEISEEIVSNV